MIFSLILGAIVASAVIAVIGIVIIIRSRPKF
jgi:hypothetical protein